MTVVRLATSNSSPQKRACSTCRHGPRSISQECLALGRSIYFERQDEESACGLEGNLWEPRPRRIGLVGYIKRLIFGDPT